MAIKTSRSDVEAQRCWSACSSLPSFAVTSQCEHNSNHLPLRMTFDFQVPQRRWARLTGTSVTPADYLMWSALHDTNLLPMKEVCTEADSKLPACMVLQLCFHLLHCSLWVENLLIKSQDLSERDKDFRWLSGCFCFYFRKAPQRWQLRTDSALRNVQCSKRENTFASQQMDKTPSYPLWNMPNCLISKRKPDWKDACPPFNWWKSKIFYFM